MSMPQATARMTNTRGASPVPLRTIRAIDLTDASEYRALWQNAAKPGELLAAASAALGPGRPSPMGFWLTEVPGPAPEAAESGGLRILVYGPEATMPAGEPRQSPRRRPVQTVRLHAPSNTDGDVALLVDGTEARVTARESAWAAMAEPITLAVCQYWRFAGVQETLDRLTEQARSDVPHAALPGLRSLRDARRLGRQAEAVRELLIDLAHFEGAITDPFPYCTTERSANLYGTLVEKLRLEEWCELIDERCEAIEDTYEAVTEKLFEFKNFAWEALLEAVIVVILLGELGIMLWEQMS